MDNSTTTEVTTVEAAPVSPALAAIRLAMAPLAAANLERIASIDEASAKVAGTLAAKVKAAHEVVVANAKGEDHPVNVLATLRQQMDLLEALEAEANEAISGLVNSYLKETSASGDEVSALKTERDELVTSTNAMAVVMGSEVSIPKAPRILGGKGTRSLGGSVTRTTGAFYVLEADGTRKFFSKDTLAYIAFAYGVSVVDLKTALSGAGWDAMTVGEATVTLVASKKGGRTASGVSNTFTVGLETTDEA